MKLTKNFDLEEFFVSAEYPDEAIILYNQIAEHTLRSEKIIDSLFLLCYFMLQPARDNARVKMEILSGYRGNYLNRKIGGSANSRHMIGKAADFTINNKDMLHDMFVWMKENLHDRVGELILYRRGDGIPNFIHVSLPRLGAKVNVKEVKK